MRYITTNTSTPQEARGIREPNLEIIVKVVLFLEEYFVAQDFAQNKKMQHNFLTSTYDKSGLNQCKCDIEGSQDFYVCNVLYIHLSILDRSETFVIHIRARCTDEKAEILRGI